jgi:predicted RNase H-like HicB family nuclease
MVKSFTRRSRTQWVSHETMKTPVKPLPSLETGRSTPRKTPTLHVILQPCEEGGFTAICPEIPGAISEGDTKEEAVENLADAMKCVLEVSNEVMAERILAYSVHTGRNARPLKPRVKKGLCETR